MVEDNAAPVDADLRELSFEMLASTKSLIPIKKGKLYLFDTGLLGALAAISPTEIFKYDFGSWKGFSAEVNHFSSWILEETLISC